MTNIHRIVAELAGQGRGCALAVVLEADGSTPGRTGAKAVMTAEGLIQGTIGGGLVEAEAQRRAAEVIQSGRSVVLDFNLDSRGMDGTEPICGGAMRVLVTPISRQLGEAYAIASALRQHRQRGVLLTAIQGRRDPKVSVQCLAEREIALDLGFPGAQVVRTVLACEQPELLVSESDEEGERLEVVVEPVIPEPVLVIVGGGHVGQAVAAQAALVGFALVVIDDRPEFTCPERFPDGAILRCGMIEEELAGLQFDADTYIVIVTRGHKHDADALAACIHKPLAYVGMIGSRRKVAMMRKDFVESGLAAPEEFDRVYAPIGLDIGSVTVTEIAVSIVAQIISVRRKGASSRFSTT